MIRHEISVSNKVYTVVVAVVFIVVGILFVFNGTVCKVKIKAMLILHYCHNLLDLMMLWCVPGLDAARYPPNLRGSHEGVQKSLTY